MRGPILVLLVTTFVLIRNQFQVGEEQFLRSMKIVQLCDRSVQSQQEDIRQMEAILERRH